MAEPEINKLGQALQGLTIGVVNNLRDFDKMRRLDGLMEREEQIQVPVEGEAQEFAAWSSVEIEFENIFVDATGQRDSPFDRPHFYSGAEVFTETPVVIEAVVMEWITNDRNETTGVKVAIGVMGTDRATTFQGAVHLTFQGYGQPVNPFPDD